MRKNLHTAEKETKSTTTSNPAENSKYDESLRSYEQSILQNFENVLCTMRTEKDANFVFLFMRYQQVYL